MLYDLLPILKTIAQASTSGFGGIHAAILYLAAKTLGNQRWSDTVKPTTDEELNEAAVTMPGMSV